MAIQVNSQVVDATKVYRIRVTLTSMSVIADPVAYVSQPVVWTEVLAIAGLPQLLFTGASLITQGYQGVERYYVLDMSFDATHVLATGHSHDTATVFMPLRESYRDGPYIDLDPTLGPVDIWSDLTPAVDFFKIRQVGAQAPYLLVKSTGTVQLDAHLRYWIDSTRDIGSEDGGVTLRRPRNVYVGNNVEVGGDIEAEGYGHFGEELQGTHYRFTSQPSNPSNDPAVRHIYWNSSDNTLRGWDGSVEFIIGGGSGMPLGPTGIYDCPAGLVVGEVVCIVGMNTVDKADASMLGLRPVIGICVNKPLPNVAVVQTAGEVNVFAGSLVPNQLYFLGQVPGTIITNPNVFNPGETIQLVGVSKTTNVLTLRYESRINLG